MPDLSFLAAALFVLGAIIGSFLNVVILRLPEEGESIVFPASRCPVCKTPLAWYDNIPLLSFLLLRGRCRSCRVRISWQYPLVELAMALLSMALVLRFDLSLALLRGLIFCAALLAVSVIDLRLQIIPDRISLPGIVLGLLFALVTAEPGWRSSAIGILAGGGSLYLIAWGYHALTGRDGMGGGDIKLLAMIGGFLGWQSLLFVLFASSLLGSLVGLACMWRQGRGGLTRIPFGPFLALGALLDLLFRPQILLLWQLYLNAL
ncbi:MAG: prepilin peptidase [Desulfobulbaceae bacterium A2]|nr:MAG: prepilin peptidase [Desulfobulbaceae bacterium A2]